jgi:hypothetical protein
MSPVHPSGEYNIRPYLIEQSNQSPLYSTDVAGLGGGIGHFPGTDTDFVFSWFFHGGFINLLGFGCIIEIMPMPDLLDLFILTSLFLFYPPPQP